MLRQQQKLVLEELKMLKCVLWSQ